MAREVIKPFMINKDEDGQFRLTVRDIRYNSQGYPIVASHLQKECFKSATAARNFAQEHFQAQAGQFATK